MGRGAGILRAMEPVPEPAAETRTRRIPFASSLAGRMILYGVAPMVAVVIAMYVMGATTRYQALRDDAETREERQKTRQTGCAGRSRSGRGGLSLSDID